MNNISFAIGIPTINQWDILEPVLKKYFIDFPDTKIYLIDNGNQNIDIQHDNLIIIPNTERKSVAASWNILCLEIYKKHSHAFILNDDVEYNQGYSSIYNTIAHYPADLYKSTIGFCSFILPKPTFRLIGSFDENFKGAYFEDNDYERRLRLKKLSVIISSWLNPVIYRESSSIKKDPSLNSHYQDNARYYVNKWGGHRGGEKFITPFNK